MEAVSLSRQSVPVIKLVRAQMSESRIALPVSRGVSVYAQLKNISGVPASGQGASYSMAKLRSLDALIERLKQLKPDTPGEDVQGLSGRELDRMIEKYQKEFHTALKSRRNPDFRQVSPTGVALNLLV